MLYPQLTAPGPEPNLVNMTTMLSKNWHFASHVLKHRSRCMLIALQFARRKQPAYIVDSVVSEWQAMKWSKEYLANKVITLKHIQVPF